MEKLKILIRSTSSQMQNELVSSLGTSNNIQILPVKKDVPNQKGATIVNRITSLFEEYDLAIFTISEGDSEEDLIISEKDIILEVGMSIMKYGLERTLLIVPETFTKPSNLDGFTPLNYEGDISTVKDWMPQFAEQVQNWINNKENEVAQEKQRATEKQQKSERYWLSLIDCAPGEQTNVKSKTDQQVKEYNYGISYENSGIIYGEYDNFLLFKSPSTQAAGDFITKLRQNLDDDIISIDTRLVFTSPGKFWKDPDYSAQNDKNLNDLVLLSCRPYKVEEVYNAIYGFVSGDYEERTFGCKVTYLGIIFGRHDIFFIINAEKIESIDRFITDTLGNDVYGIKKLLARNTTSLRIRSIPND